MKFFKHIMTAAFVAGVLSVGVLADEQKNDKPPKKPEVVERPEKQRPPRNENRGNNSGDDRGRGNNDNRRGRP